MKKLLLVEVPEGKKNERCLGRFENQPFKIKEWTVL